MHEQLLTGYQSYGNLIFQAVVVSILLYGCTTSTLMKHIEKKLNGNYTRMLHAVLNKSCKQHPTKHLTSHLSKTNRWGTTGEIRKNTEATFSYGLLYMDLPVLTDQLRLTYITSVWTHDADLKTSQEQWMIGMDGKKELGNFMLSACLDTDDDDDDDLKCKIATFYWQYKKMGNQQPKFQQPGFVSF